MAFPLFTEDEEFYTAWYSSSEEDSGRSNLENSISDEEDGEVSESIDLAMIRNALIKHGLSMDFEPWLNAIPAWIKELKEDLVPGTYQHYLLLLLDTSENIVSIQGDMQQFLADRYPDEFNEVTRFLKGGVYGGSEMELLASEFQTLRSLVRPLRNSISMNSIIDCKWKSRKGEDAIDTVRALRRASKIIHEFREDVLTETPSEKDRLSLNSPGGEALFKLMNARLARTDDCEDSMRRNSPEDPSSSMGKDLDNQMEIPEMSQETEERSSYQPQLNTNELMFTIAVWLSRTRGSTAVDLFCDVAKIFVSRLPKGSLTDDEFWYLHFLASLYPEDSGRPSGSNPWIGYDPDMSNSTYFRDVARSQESLMASIRKGPVTPRTFNDMVPPPVRHGFQLTSHGGPLDGRHGKTTDPKAAARQILH
ncbi:hypothetical protein FQN54_008194 [Arachnomyces sp. PD_36]|nr:hypothetical protein FQN54_008194 [Arachnomyces sp. PD_36]